MKVSAFIRTYRNDFGWLEYCLRSLKKYGGAFCEVVVACPAKDLNEMVSRFDVRRDLPPNLKLIGVPEFTVNGYIDQQITKCHADEFCEGDFIMHLDSDCMATEPIKFEPFFSDGLPKLLFRKWEDAGGAQVWKPITKSVLIREPLFETMPAMPFLYHRSTHELFRRHITDIHGRDFVKYASRLAQFSEFNAIGNFCLMFCPDAYRFIRAGGAGDTFPRPFKQHWSRGRMNRDEMEAILK